MRELHVVAVSEDGRHVLLAGKRGATTGGFRVALDDRLSAAVRGDLPRPGVEPAGRELTPKEIQARLRSGESAEAIALSAGVPVTRVERFAGPVQGEMARMIDAARSAYLVRGRLGRSAVPLGVAVDGALAPTPSLRPDSIEWETRRDEDGNWLVTVNWFARARPRSASWRYDPAAKSLTPADPASAALGHLDADAPLTPSKRGTATSVAAAPKKAPKKASAGRAGAKKALAKRAAATEAPAKRAAATEAPAKRAGAKKAPAKRAAATEAPAKRAGAKKAAAAKAPGRKPAALAAKPAATKAVAVKTTAKQPGRKAPTSKVPTAKKVSAKVAAAPVKKAPARPGKARTLRVVPDPEPRRTRITPAERDGVKTRATVPDWADVLLGTSPGRDR